MKILSRHIFAFLLAFAILCSTFVHSACAQCPPSWLPANSLPGLNGAVLATKMWDPDGQGPLPNVLVVAGDFTIAGNVIANGIATWNPASGRWATLGGGFGPDGSGDALRVSALTTLPNGELIAGGNFGTADGEPANHIARWNGTQWLPMGNGMTGVQYPIISELITMPNGDVVAAGEFLLADGLPATNIARWNGSTWSPLIGSNYRHSSPVVALALLPDGRLAAASTVPATWDGTDWTLLGPGPVDGNVFALAALPTGELIVSGDFYQIGTTVLRDIALWNGSAWTALGGNPGCKARSILVEPNGHLIACGSGVSSVSRWNGSTWSAFSPQNASRPIYTAALLPDGSLIVGGDFIQVGAVQASHIARLASGTWLPLGTGLDGDVNAMTTLPNGDLIIGGHATHYSGVDYAARIARWNGSAFSPLGNGLTGDGTDFVVSSLTSRPNGNVVAGGIFSRSGTTPVTNIANWNGSSWNQLATGLNGAVWALTSLPNGNIVAAGEFTLAGTTSVNRIARWDGSQWFPLALGLDGEPLSGRIAVFALHSLPNGDLIAGGTFTKTGSFLLGRLARWNGTAWSSMAGNAFSTVYAIAALPDSSIVANGLSNGVGRWSGTAWARLGGTFDGPIFSLKTLSNGNLIAGGEFTRASLSLANGVAKWNGTTWSPLGAGISTTQPSYYPRYVNVLAESPNGILNVGGHFELAGGQVSPYFARYAFNPAAPTITQHPASLSTCPAATANFSISASGTDPLSYIWQYQSPANTWTDLDEGNNPNIGFITGVHTPSISISNLGPAADSNYRVTISNSCGTTISNPAALTICPADFNCDNSTDFFDYLDFVQAFASNDPAADFNQDSTIDLLDYLDFVQAFTSGC